jgi:hypothetical protein
MTRHRLAPRSAAVLLAALVLLQVGQTDYAVGRYIDQGMAGHGPGLNQRAWVDEEIYGKAKAGYWSVAGGNYGALYGPIAREIQFWNNSVTSVVVMDEQLGTSVPPGDDLVAATMNPTTGLVGAVRLRPGEPVRPVPRFLVVPADGLSAVYGRLVTKSAYLPAALVEWKPPLRMRWSIKGTEPDGWLRPDVATVRVFAAPLAQRSGQCVSVDVRAPVAWHGGWEVKSDGFRRRAEIEPRGFARVEVPLRAIAAGKPYQDVTLTGRGKQVKIEDGRTTTVQLAAVDVKPCGA